MNNYYITFQVINKIEMLMRDDICESNRYNLGGVNFARRN